CFFFFFSSRRRHTRCLSDWSSDVCSSDLFQKSADVDRAGVTIGAITGQAPEVYVREHVKNAKVQSLPTVPPNTEMGRMLLDGKRSEERRVGKECRSQRGA